MTRIELGLQSRPTCGTCGRRHPGECRVHQTGCYKYGQQGYFTRECPQSVIQQFVLEGSYPSIQVNEPRGRGQVQAP